MILHKNVLILNKYSENKTPCLELRFSYEISLMRLENICEKGTFLLKFLNFRAATEFLSLSLIWNIKDILGQAISRNWVVVQNFHFGALYLSKFVISTVKQWVFSFGSNEIRLKMFNLLVLSDLTIPTN